MKSLNNSPQSPSFSNRSQYQFNQISKIPSSLQNHQNHQNHQANQVNQPNQPNQDQIKSPRNDHHPSRSGSIQSDHLSQNPINSNPTSNSSPTSRLLVFLTVTFYLISALVMVFVNKWVLNSIPAPTFFLFCQLLIAIILLKISNLLRLITLPKIYLIKNLRLLKYLILINVLGLSFNTYCLQFVDASFYQVARGLILPFTVLASYIFLNTKSSYPINISIIIVCVGFFIGVSSERFTVSYLGVLLGVCSSITTSLHAIIVKRSLEKVSSTIDLTYYTNFLSAILILPMIILTGELPTVINLFESSLEELNTFIVGTLITGFFGFLICIAGILSIKVTSPVTHMISSAVRGVVQTGLGAMVFGDKITLGRIAGIGIILAGSLYYTWVKDLELNQKLTNRDQFPMSTLNKNEELVINIENQKENHDLNHRLDDNEFELEDDDERELRETERLLGFPSTSQKP